MDRRDKIEARLRRKKRIRKKVSGNAERPRLCVFKSLKNIYAQLIDDSSGRVLTGVSSLTEEIRGDIKYGGNVESAKTVGAFLGKKAVGMGITQVLFDRNGFRYHGRIKALADSAREAGLVF